MLHRITEQTSEVIGDLDPMLRLYRRRRCSETFYAHEWEDIKDSADWIEQVDDDEETVLRIDMKSAKMLGHKSGNGEWTVLLDHYSIHEQEH